MMEPSVPKQTPAPQLARRFPRFVVDMRVSVQVFRKGDVMSLWGRSSEMGEDGVGVTLTGELEPGEVVSVEVSLPLAAYPLKVRALVRYRQGLRHGLEFLAVTSEQRAVLRRVCEMLATGQ